ncbi:hypothetical protein D3C85_1340900 [compost metagenome]
MDDGDLGGLERVDDVVAGDDALLVVTAAHAEHAGEAALGHCGVGGAGGDGDDARFVVDLGRRNGGGGAEVPDHADGLVLVDQAVGDGHGLFRFAGVVGLDQLDLLAVDAAGGVDVFGGLGSAAPVLFAKRSVGAGVRPGNADDDISLYYGRNAQRGGNRQSQKAFSENLLRHGVLLLRFLGLALVFSKWRAINSCSCSAP